MGQAVSFLWDHQQQQETTEKQRKRMFKVPGELVGLVKCAEAATGGSSIIETEPSAASGNSDLLSFHGTEASSSKETPLRDVDDGPSSFAWSQQELPLDRLSLLDSDTLRMSLDPIYRLMEAVDAESLLNLERVDSDGRDDGATLHSSVRVRPIHDMIQPPKPPGVLRYLYVAEVDYRYSIGIFVFPPFAKIPLHDHPGMCVLSRILYGSVQRTSLDLMRSDRTGAAGWGGGRLRQYLFGLSGSNHNFHPDASNDKEKRRIARLCETETLVAPAVTILYPHEGNLHEFTAGPQGAAVLDVLLPPYDPRGDRNCDFYQVVGSANDQDGLVLFEQIEQPHDFHCLSGYHMGVGE